MNVQYTVGGKPLDWKKVSLTEYIEEYVPPGWEDVFEAAEDILPEISKKLKQFAVKNTVYPPMPLVFNALDSLRPEEIKVVVLGQDAYINEGEAMGWSFSVPDGVKIPPSLRNIYKELHDEGYTGYKGRQTGDLGVLVEKGVFLYNTCLTVNAGVSYSHGTTWKEFTDLVIGYISQQENVAWILLGEKAQAFAKKLDKERHGIFKAGHPSPLNRKGDFAGSGVFKAAEKYLNKHDKKFSWSL